MWRAVYVGVGRWLCGGLCMWGWVGGYVEGCVCGGG